jgi:hypothetical protein
LVLQATAVHGCTWLLLLLLPLLLKANLLDAADMLLSSCCCMTMLQHIERKLLASALSTAASD